MKFKAGDKVRILDESSIEGYAGDWVGWKMCKEIHKIYAIKGNCIFLKGLPFAFNERDLEPVNETIVIYRKDREVIALDKSTGRKAVAKCHPSDEFDFHVGASLVFGRLFCQELLARVVKNHKLDMDSADGKIFSNIKQMAKDFANFKNKPMSELLGYQEEPKLYNGKVVCVKSEVDCLTNGKIYEFVDGYSKYDNGKQMPSFGRAVESFEDLGRRFMSKFIEIVEDK